MPDLKEKRVSHCGPIYGRYFVIFMLFHINDGGIEFLMFANI